VVSQAHILSVSLLDQQDIEFAEAGRVVLCIEGPRFTRRFAHLHYELSAYDGTRLRGRTIWFRLLTSGVSKVRLELKSYQIPQPGRYRLWIQGLGTGWTADAKHRIVFMRPHLARSIGYIIGILLAGGLLIGSIVLFFLRLTLNGADA
jgi:hypothetical protein